jgi:hypothetical protein
MERVGFVECNQAKHPMGRVRPDACLVDLFFSIGSVAVTPGVFGRITVWRGKQPPRETDITIQES